MTSKKRPPARNGVKNDNVDLSSYVTMVGMFGMSDSFVQSFS